MTKLLSFRGQITVADNARSTDNNIFTYTSPDLTRAWKVESFYLWPKSVRAEIGTADGQFQISASLATDTIGSAAFDDVMSVEDNRQIGWISKGYNLRAASSDFITSPTGLEDNQAIVDPDHIVNRNLFINFYSTSDSSTSPARDYNYLLILREVKVSESEAILQMVKGVAQDIIN
jgi:hypothetical protein|tara:strand:- start:698 stop:1225 length:528 start_codon:yes stop_codon:yes gene_type:complete